MDERTVTGRIDFKIAGEPVEIEMTVPADPVPLSRMLPVLSMATDRFVEVGVQASRSNGESVSCRKGCSACCRQLVPISETEAFDLARLVDELPEPLRSQVAGSFTEAVSKFAVSGLSDYLDQYASLPEPEQTEIHRRYYQLGISCPFLYDDACSIHEKRPLVCREFLVTSDAANCWDPFKNPIKPVKLLFKTTDALRDLSRTEMFIPLIVSLEVARRYPRDERLKSGQEWIGAFFERLIERTSTEVQD